MLKKFEIFEVISNYLVNLFFVDFPIQMDQTITKFCHFDKSVAKRRIDYSDVSKLNKNISIGLRRVCRFIKLLKGNQPIANVEATFNRKLQKPL